MKKLLILMAAMMFVMGFAMTASAGSYYKYADFSQSGSAFLGGYDVDSYGNYIYVNRYGYYIDRYTVTTATGTPPQDANTHPDNLGLDGAPGVAGVDDDGNGVVDDAGEKNYPGSDDNVGPMLTRTLTYDTTYYVPEIGSPSHSEIYATADTIYFASDDDRIAAYDLSSGTVTYVTNALSGSDGYGTGINQIARASDGTWYASNESNNVYRYNGSSWNLLFTHNVHLGGSHLDGLEVVSMDVDGDNVVDGEYLFTADMTADYLDRYDLAGTHLETYTYTANPVVEGLGFGANNHFWATGSGHLYELGGGALSGTTENPVPEPATMFLLGSGLLGLAGFRKRFFKK